MLEGAPSLRKSVVLPVAIALSGAGLLFAVLLAASGYVAIKANSRRIIDTVCPVVTAAFRSGGHGEASKSLALLGASLSRQGDALILSDALTSATVSRIPPPAEGSQELPDAVLEKAVKTAAQYNQTIQLRSGFDRLYTACPVGSNGSAAAGGPILALTLLTETPPGTLTPNWFSMAAAGSVLPIILMTLVVLDRAISRRVTKHLTTTIDSISRPEPSATGSVFLPIAHDAPREIQGTIAAVRDVLSKIEENTAFLTATFEASPIGILQIGPEGTLLYANSFFLNSSGLQLEEAKGLGWFKAIHPEERPTFAVEWYASLQQHISFEGYQRLLTPSGEVRHAIIKAGAIIRDSKAGGFIATVLDVTDTKQAIDAMIAARDSAEAATRSKSDFLAAVSHELRTPLNAITTLSQMLVADPVAHDVAEGLITIRDAGQSLLTIINDLLDLSKVEAGKMELNPAQFEIRPFLKRMITLLSVRSKEKEVDLQLHVDERIAPHVYGDDVRLGQVLINLIGNGIKFTPTGGTVALHVTPSKDPSIIDFSIKDSGIGIPADKLKVIFNPYDQGESGTHRKFGGTGLGLHVSQRLIKLLGGVLRVESQVDRGSTFSFSAILPRIAEADERLVEPSLPAELPIEELPTTTEVIGQIPLRILLAEDNPTNQKITLRILTQMGHDVTAVSNGQEAVAAVRNERPFGFDVILMDYHMPIMDGLEATRTIRELEEQTGLSTPILALTANSMVRERDACLEAGMDDFISKPINVAAFKIAVQKWGIKSRSRRV